MEPSKGQTLALRQLHRIANVAESALSIDNVEDNTTSASALVVDVSLDCTHYERATGGMLLHTRESVRLWIPTEFPYRLPTVTTAHTRFSGKRHVQWGVQLCLYLAPESQWLPSQGMFGFIRQLDNWFRQAALNALDAPEGPIHPPVAYTASDTKVLARTIHECGSSGAHGTDFACFVCSTGRRVGDQTVVAGLD